MRPPKVRARVKYPVAVLVFVVLSVAGFVVFRDPPVQPFQPVSWKPAPSLTAPAVTPAGRIVPLLDSPVDGPEDLAVDAAGLVYTGDRQGRILRIDPATGSVEVFAEVGGRPLGLAIGPDRNLIVANHGVGLQAVSPDGRVRLLTDAAGGTPIAFANDVAIAPDGMIYFSDASSRHHLGTLGAVPSYSLFDLLEGRPHGRLLRHDPATGRTTQLLTGLYFPNGVVATADGRSVLVAESTRYRITRLRLDTGASDVLIDGLPGLADGFTRAADGTLLLALYDRVPTLDRFVLPFAWARELVVRLPQTVLVDEDRPQAGSILVLDDDGRVLRHLVGAAPAAANVVPYRDRWLVGSLTGDRVRIMSPPA
jgi:sugar lactone lactonase YvrE